MFYPNALAWFFFGICTALFAILKYRTYLRSRNTIAIQYVRTFIVAAVALFIISLPMFLTNDPGILKFTFIIAEMLGMGVSITVWRTVKYVYDLPNVAYYSLITANLFLIASFGYETLQTTQVKVFGDYLGHTLSPLASIIFTVNFVALLVAGYFFLSQATRDNTNRFRLGVFGISHFFSFSAMAVFALLGNGGGSLEFTITLSIAGMLLLVTLFSPAFEHVTESVEQDLSKEAPSYS